MDHRRGADRLGPHRRALLGLAGARARRPAPDILTFAKGIGNGMSIGGVVARAEIMNCLARNSISTFGGTPVTAAGASPTSATCWNTTCRATPRGRRPARRAARAATSPIVGEVRGRGLMIGVELVRPGTGHRRARARAASAVLEAAKRRGLLIGKGGLHGNALRIAPPLSLTVARGGRGARPAHGVDRGRGGAGRPRRRVRRGGGGRRHDATLDPRRPGHHRGRRDARRRADRGRAGRRPRRARLAGRGLAGPPTPSIDATGKYVIPGGVDAHTHMEMPFGGTYASDTFETGTRAAAWGGTTTIVDFADPVASAQPLREGLDAWHAKADGNCAIDYGFHMILSDVNEGTLKEMDLLVEEGVTSFKLFMAYPGVFYSDDGQILRAMQRGAENGGLIMMHAENGIAIDVLVEQALARGETDPRYHGEVRHALLEAEATHRAIQLAQVAGAPLYVVHVSAEEAVAELARARDEGCNAFGETCPQYLFLSTDNLAEPGLRGRQVRLLDAAAPAASTRRRCGGGCAPNDLQVVSTDHCPFCFEGQKELGRGDFSKIPNGLPGVENRMDLLHQAVVDGHISRRRWIEIACATPARMFGLYPRKGTDRAGRRRRHRHLRPARRAGALRARPTT